MQMPAAAKGTGSRLSLIHILRLIGGVALGMTAVSMVLIPYVARFFVGYDARLVSASSPASYPTKKDVYKRQALEQAWGDFRFNLYVLLGMVGAVLACLTSLLILHLMLRSAEQETPRPTGQEAP